MQRIIISEKDLTSNVEVVSSYDVAYVPGFTANGDAASKLFRQPKLYTSKYAFVKEIAGVGNTKPAFTQMQEYPAWVSGTTDGFVDGAIPPSTSEDGKSHMFEAGEVDLGYRIALYLLSLGMPVYYEVMNNSVTENTYEIKYTYTKVNENRAYNSALTYYIGKSTVSDDSVVETVAIGSEQSKFKVAQASDFAPTGGFASGKTYFTVSIGESCGICVPAMYAGLKARFISDPTQPDNSFDTIGDYSIKYITSGGYPTFEYASKSGINTYSIMTGMVELAGNRKDATALIDHTDNPTRDLYPSTLGGSGNSVIDIVRTVAADLDNASYASMYTPWYECSHGAITEGAIISNVPGSVGFLTALAVQIRDYNPWLAVAGVIRGRVPNLVSLHTNQVLTNNIADAYQVLPSDNTGVAQISINPITYVRNVGYCLWGNRTLRNNSTGTVALSFMNLRGVVSDVKKTLYEASQQNLFEQNTDVTWINFKGKITPLLDRLVSNRIIQDYSVVRYMVNPESGDTVPSYTVLAVITIRPIGSIEVFDLTVQIQNSEVSIDE